MSAREVLIAPDSNEPEASAESSSVSVAPPVPVVPPTQARTKRKKKIDAPVSDSFEVLIEVLQPDRKVRTANRKYKTEKVDPRKVGPFTVALAASWDELLEVIAKETGAVIQGLVVQSFEWHFLKPASSPWLPLCSEQGFQSMVNQVTAKIMKDGSSYVIFRMREPTIRAIVQVSRVLQT